MHKNRKRLRLTFETIRDLRGVVGGQGTSPLESMQANCTLRCESAILCTNVCTAECKSQALVEGSCWGCDANGDKK